MKVLLNLHPDGPPMWFLGSPGKIVCSLSVVSPGPVEIDFEGLGRGEKVRVLEGLRDEEIESSVPFGDLYKIWTRELSLEQTARTAGTPTPPPPNSPDFATYQKMKIEKKAQERTQWLKERCHLLQKSSSHAAKSLLAGVEDLSILNAFLKAEQEGKNRASLIQAIRHKIERVSVRRIEQANKASQKAIRGPVEKTKGLKVIKSKHEVVLLPDELIQASLEEEHEYEDLGDVDA